MSIFNYFKLVDNFFLEKLSKSSKNLLVSFISILGSFFFTIIFLIIIYFLPLRNLSELIITILISIIIDTIIVFIVKFSVRRKRQNEKKYFNRIDTYSFPSGHVSRLAAFLVPLINYPFIIIFFIILIIIVSFARMVKEYHYFSDCLVGFLIGLFSGMFSLILFNVYIDLVKKIINCIYSI